MAYKVVQIRLVNTFTSRFKAAEDDDDFDARSYPELDDYLSMMETRGWDVVSTSTVQGSGTTGYMLITLHQPDPAVLGSGA